MAATPDDVFITARQAHRIESLEQELAVVERAHDQLDDEYGRATRRCFALEDQVEDIPRLELENSRLADRALQTEEESSAVRKEAGEIRDEKTLWHTKANLYKLVAKWVIGIAVVEAAVISSGAVYWAWALHHPALH